MPNKIIDTMIQLENEPSTNAKIAILKKASDCETLTSYLKYACSAEFVFGVKKLPTIHANGQRTISQESIDTVVDTCLNTSGNERIDRLCTQLANHDSISADLLERLIKKDLCAGFSGTLINKAYGKVIIPKFDVMLASKMEDKTLAKMPWPAMVQTKMDGMRVMIFVKDGKVTAFSRNGKPVDAISPAHAADFITLSGAQAESGAIFDGELLHATSPDRKTGNGICNKAIKGTISSPERDGFRFVLWDMIPFAEYSGDAKTKVKYKDRLQNLENGFAQSLDTLSLVDFQMADDYEAAQVYYAQMRKNGEEGAIIKNVEAFWEPKRSKSLIKMKAVETADMEIIEVIEGDKKNVGKLGAFRVKTSCGEVVTKCGSGFNDAQRVEFWEQRNELIGKIVECQYNEVIIASGETVYKLFLPIFICMRPDKDEANTRAELK